MVSDFDITNLLTSLKNANLLPKCIDKTVHKSVFFYNVYNVPLGKIMSYDVSTGVDTDEKTALLKALIEHVERNAFSESLKNSLFPLHKYSDGFAAFPTHFPGYLSKAREHALAEATERFVWANWWDNKTAAKVTEVFISDLDLHAKELLEFIGPKRIYKIEPVVKNNDGIGTLILFMELASGGYISGGAAGKDPEHTLFRASSEAIRHHLGFSNYKKFNLSPTHFYDERLIFFAEGRGNKLVLERLKSTSDQIITLPKLTYDQLVPHSLEEIVCVYRCLFENQPLFVGGDLNRLCI